MKKNKKWLAVKLFLFIILICPLFAVAGINEAATYLESLDPDPWVTQALLVSGKSEVSLDHLKTVSGTLATDYAKVILAIVAAGENPSAFGNIDYIDKLKTYLNNDQIGDSGLLNDDMWAIIALGACNESASTEAQKAKEYIIANQNSNGGWGYAVGGDSDTNDTAAGIIALREAGVLADDAVIVNALNYLKTAQNNDGGFGWISGSDSDSGSDSWVIIALNKLGIDSTSWIKESNSPLSHLQTLQDIDGGFWWTSPGTSKAMTSFAVIALSGKSFPIAYLSDTGEEESGYGIRIEGADNTICNTLANGDNVLDVIKNAAIKCNFTYNIKDTSYGPYLEQINTEKASGTSGWLYFVNYESPSVGMADYSLSANDEILVYFGEWGNLPIKISADKTSIQSSETVVITASYFSEGQWNVLDGANIKGVAQEYATDSMGKADITLADGYYSAYAEKDGYVRSNQIAITVGRGIANNISLAVEIESTGTDVAGASLIFTVSPDALNFGKIKAGQESKQILSLNNSGTVDLALSANVDGDTVFKNNLKLAEQAWSEYAGDILHGNSQDLEVSLAIPNSYLESGVKTGELIIWASPK